MRHGPLLIVWAVKYAGSHRSVEIVMFRRNPKWATANRLHFAMPYNDRFCVASDMTTESSGLKIGSEN